MNVWLPLLFSLVLLVGIIIGYQLQSAVGRSNNITSGNNTVDEVLELVKAKYVDKINLDTLNGAAIDAVLNKLDPHTVYIPPSKVDDIASELRGNFQGIGIEFLMLNDTMNVTSVVEKGPSEMAGLHVGDQIIKVGDSTVAGVKRDPDSLRKFIRGQKGTLVDISIIRNGQSIVKTVKRGVIPIPSVDAAYIASPGVGYLKLNKFSETTYIEFMSAMDTLKSRGMKSLILDLRGNGGGVLEAAVNIADEFLEDGKMIVYTEGANVAKKEYPATKPGVFEEGKLVVLMDELSASASEVLAGALQDNDRATIIGRRSFGKGLVQEQFELSNGGGLRLTVARYYTPLGRSIQKSYTGGRKLYNEEVLDRINHTDTLLNDSSYKKGKVYKTTNGRLVYGGGGISPDIYVPMDSGFYSSSSAKLFAHGVLLDFAFNMYKNNLAAFPKFANAQAFDTTYVLPANTWEQLVGFAKKDSIDLPNNTALKNEALLLIKANLANFKWRKNGFYEVENTNDATFKKALEVVK